MGMFDTIWFVCPNCKQRIEEQSKAGECMLKDYSQEAVPLEIAVDILHSELYCENCKETYVIAANNIPPPTTIEMRLEKK